MASLRTFILSNSRLAALLLAAALLMKALVPAGFMPEANGRGLSIEICDASSDAHQLVRIDVPRSGKTDTGKHDRSDSMCPFGALAHAAHPGDAPTLPAALAPLAALLLGGLYLAASPRLLSKLRPPLRGPPAIA